MRLTQRLLLGSLIVVSVIVICVVGVINYRLNPGVTGAVVAAPELLRAAKRDVVLTGCIALLLASVIAFLFARAVSKPIEELRDVARALAAEI